MLYSLLEYLGTHFDLPGAGLFRYLSFRSVCAIVFALLIGAIFGKKIIERLRRHQIGEEIRNLGLEGQMEKRGTPTMGGLIILGAMLIPVILFCDLGNVYIQLMIVSSVWLGLLGFADDYIKVFRKHKEGLKGRFKIIGQVGLGIIVGTVMCFSRDIVIIEKSQPKAAVVNVRADNTDTATEEGYTVTAYPGNEPQKTTKTTIPFVKNNEFDYHWLVPTDKPWGDVLTWLIYILIAIFIITAVSNGANLTDYVGIIANGITGSTSTINEESQYGTVAYTTEDGYYVFEVYIVTDRYIYQAELRFLSSLMSQYSMYTSYLENSFVANELYQG